MVILAFVLINRYRITASLDATKKNKSDCGSMDALSYGLLLGIGIRDYELTRRGHDIHSPLRGPGRPHSETMKSVHDVVWVYEFVKP